MVFLKGIELSGSTKARLKEADFCPEQIIIDFTHEHVTVNRLNCLDINIEIT